MRISRAVALVSCVFLLTAITGCGEPATDESENSYVGAYLYGADGNMSNPFGAQFEKHPGVAGRDEGHPPDDPDQR